MARKLTNLVTTTYYSFTGKEFKGKLNNKK